MEARPQGNRLLLGVILFGGGVFAGFGGAEVLSAPDPGDRSAPRDEVPRVSAPTPTRERTADSDELAAALVDLRLTLESLRGALDSWAALPAAEESRRIPVSEADGRETDEGLAASIRALAAAVQTLPRGGGGSESEANLRVPAWIDRGVAFATDNLKASYRVEDDGEAAEEALRAFRSAHMFWTKQEILDRYGKPDSIYREDDFVEWCYQLSSTNESEDVDFSFDGGVVVGVDYGYDWYE